MHESFFALHRRLQDLAALQGFSDLKFLELEDWCALARTLRVRLAALEYRVIVLDAFESRRYLAILVEYSFSSRGNGHTRRFNLVQFISHQCYLDIGVRVVLDKFEPSMQALKSGPIGDIVHQKCANRVTIMNCRHLKELLAAGSVPYLSAHSLKRAWQR